VIVNESRSESELGYGCGCGCGCGYGCENRSDLGYDRPTRYRRCLHPLVGRDHLDCDLCDCAFLETCSDFEYDFDIGFGFGFGFPSYYDHDCQCDCCSSYDHCSAPPFGPHFPLPIP